MFNRETAREIVSRVFDGESSSLAIMYDDITPDQLRVVQEKRKMASKLKQILLHEFTDKEEEDW